MSEADAAPPRPDHAVHAGLAGDHILRNRSVLGIGLGSLLSDTGHEMGHRGILSVALGLDHPGTRDGANPGPTARRGAR